MSSDSRHVSLRHGRVDLALHELRSASGPVLLLLHGLGEATPRQVPGVASAWPGPVWGLDFTGHGSSSVPLGGGYTAELLLADVDHAVAHLGSVTILGRGLGAYVGLLAAGARPDRVLGLVMADGPGLFGGGSVPGNRPVVRPQMGGSPEVPDPFALLELSRDVRPPDYALLFAHLALSESRIDEPIEVCCVNQPEWLAAVCGLPGVRSSGGVAESLERYADMVDGGADG